MQFHFNIQKFKELHPELSILDPNFYFLASKFYSEERQLDLKNRTSFERIFTLDPFSSSEEEKHSLQSASMVRNAYRARELAAVLIDGDGKLVSSLIEEANFSSRATPTLFKAHAPS